MTPRGAQAGLSAAERSRAQGTKRTRIPKWVRRTTIPGREDLNVPAVPRITDAGIME
jgi:hypothetical protein